MKEIRVGIIGFGTVGSGVARCLLDNASVIEKRAGIRIRLVKIADIDITTLRGVDIPDGILTTDANELINESDIVVELIGGTGVAKKFILQALSAGKSVVTANKALISEYGMELFSAARESKADLYYEASVAGGIPIIKSLREGLAGNRIDKIYGILNGTCNYILTKMENDNEEFDVALKKAAELGYAEADPSLDIDGFDTAHKTVILASLAYGEWFGSRIVHIEGIRGLSLTDIILAREFGYKIKLLGMIKKTDEDIEIRIHPVMIPANTIMASISDVYNGVYVEGTPIGKTLFYGRGAGKDATSSAVVADIIDEALNISCGSVGRIPPFRESRQFRSFIPMEDVISRYYLRIQVSDESGVIARISAILGSEQISMASFIQKEDFAHSKHYVPIVIITYKTSEKRMMRAIEQIQQLNVVHEKIKVIRIEDI